MLISKFKQENEEVNTAELEALVGLKLPEQYLIFLKKYNGGHTPDTNWTGKCKNDVRAFYGFNVKDKNWDIAHNLTYISVQDLIKENRFPIAENCFGDAFCLDCSDGSVWFVAHDSPKNKKIADDFKSFVAGCKSKKIGHIRTIEERRKCLFDNFGEEPTEAQLKGWQAEIDEYSKMVQEEVTL